MKKEILLTVLATILSASTAFAQQEFKMSGTFTDVKNDTLKVEFTKREPKKESVKLRVPIDEAGRFAFSCAMQYAYSAKLQLESNKETTYFDMVPGEEAQVKGPFGKTYEWAISGTPFYQEYAELLAARKPFLAKQDEIEAQNNRGLAAGGDKDSLKQARNKAMREVNEAYDPFIEDWIAQHPDNESSATIVLYSGFSKIGKLIAMLSPRVRNGRFKQQLDTRQEMYDRITKARNASKKAKNEFGIGRQAPEIALQDFDGNEMKLSSLLHKGKHVLVDFWGSWCVWCVKGFPKMKEYYAKYAGKLEILGVDCDDTLDKWKAAVKKHRLPWKHVRSADGTTEVRYAVHGYPHKVLIAPDGKVLKAFTGESEDFYKYLDETLAR